MDGYSVNEAAAVLGIPEGRVWELLARGVLSGSTEVGGDMRVFLRDTALTETPKREGNGNGGNGGSGSHGELTPFRELLTEFRNLTERYGQALLALGEARGEVAALRGRVDLLEARIEHRLPWTEAAPSAWAAEPDTPSDEMSDEETDGPAPGEPPGATDVVADIFDATLGPPPEREPAAELEPAVELEESAAELQPAAEVEPVSELEPAAEVAASAEQEEPVPELEEPAAEWEPSAETESSAEAAASAELEEPVAELEPRAASEDPVAELEPIAELEMPEDLDSAKPKSTVRGRAREAFTGFAEALARAQDPATESVAADFSELPGSQETADAVAAYRRDTETDPDEPQIASVSEPEIESVAVAPEATDVTETPVPVVRFGYSTDTPEPDWIAEEDLIISAGEDASVRADELARQAATPSVAVPETEIGVEVEAEPEIVQADASEAGTIEPADAWPTIEHEGFVVEPEPVEPAALAFERITPDLEPTETGVLEPEVVAPTAIADVSTTASEEEPTPVVTAATPEPAEPEVSAQPESGITAEPEPEILAEPEVTAESEIMAEPEALAAQESRLTPVDIAAEPPASEDVALLVGPEPFAEPPIVPPEPAFWEAGARWRAPFAIAQPDPWVASPVEAMPVEVAPIATPAVPDQSVAPVAQLDAAASAPAIAPVTPEPEQPPIAPERPTAAVEPPPIAPEPKPEPPRLSPAAEAGRAAAAARRRRPRGPAQRALRRLRYLLD
ncbi:MAG TPA: hypothetical protein VFP83_09285 [Candidatus Limnocylindria bacterium]|nr:hypothetical protein [Candidatus Limnocylindria bacterium]